MAHTYAILDVSAACFREIQGKLAAAGYHHTFKEGDDGELIIDMHGVALRDEEGDDDSPAAIGEPLPLEADSQEKHERSS